MARSPARQLPSLHVGLQPRGGGAHHSEGAHSGGTHSGVRWPALTRWYEAMDAVPAYACRIKGSASSWRRVLTRPPW